jgi:hypothetical protein
MTVSRLGKELEKLFVGGVLDLTCALIRGLNSGSTVSCELNRRELELLLGPVSAARSRFLPPELGRDEA